MRSIRKYLSVDIVYGDNHLPNTSVSYRKAYITEINVKKNDSNVLITVQEALVMSEQIYLTSTFAKFLNLFASKATICCRTMVPQLYIRFMCAYFIWQARIFAVRGLSLPNRWSHYENGRCTGWSDDLVYPFSLSATICDLLLQYTITFQLLASMFWLPLPNLLVL